jgi:stage III sporulation protein SpoIIIAA
MIINPNERVFNEGSTEEIDLFLEKIPPYICQAIKESGDLSSLLEVIMDIGRRPVARFLEYEKELTENEITDADIEYVTSRISPFGDDNRSGITRTLHRISCIRNRQGHIVGLTCRIGRAIMGSAVIIEDLILSGKSILLLGRPGIGKTTILREASRVLSTIGGKRVVIVDTSNEIAGDGDIPHPAIGKARRMQVSVTSQQHAVMIEAVENHMPEVIVIDEIGTEQEAMAARTIAERGVQLIGTAHGNTLENLMVNPTLSDLIGGIQSVTLGDEEAKRRGTQKTILERKSPPTFDIVVEIQDRYQVLVHPNVAEAVDGSLLGEPAECEMRTLENGKVKIVKTVPRNEETAPAPQKTAPQQNSFGETSALYLFGINASRLSNIADDMGIRLKVTDNLKYADMMVTTKAYFLRKPQKIRDAEAMNIPIYVLKNPNPNQMRHMLETLFPQAVKAAEKPDVNDYNIEKAIKEAERAVAQVKESNTPVQLSPQVAYIRRLQHMVAEKHQMGSSSHGQGTNRRVSIYPEDN